MIEFLLKTLKGTDWELLTSFVSPVFFDIVPTLGIAKVFSSIVKDFANAKEFERVRLGAEETLAKIGPPLQSLRIVSSLAHKPNLAELSVAERQEFGAMVLKIYFAQIFSGNKSILDLRSTAFSSCSEWAPKPVYFKWNESFRAGLCDLYRGFYTNDDLLLDAGLTKLNLMHAKSVISGHFGEGEQTSVRFSLKHFQKSLHDVFESCKKNRASLHPDFFALGAYLLCLYENLESLNCAFDVRGAFLEATGGAKESLNM